MELATRWQATEQVLAPVKRARESLVKVDVSTVNANGVFHHPATQLVTLKAVRDHIDKAIALIERRWPA